MSSNGIKKILVYGDAESIWIQNFLSYILQDNAYSIGLLDSGKGAFGSIQAYRSNNITFVLPPSKATDRTTRSFSKRLIYFVKDVIYLRKTCESYDYINIQFVDIRRYLRFILCRHLREKLILSFWGSDLFRINKQKMRILKSVYKTIGCYYITFDNNDLKRVFIKQISKTIKGEVIMLPLPSLDEIDNTKEENVIEIAGKLIPEYKIVIAIGYNGGEFQQHIKVLEKMGGMENKRKILIVLQMTYTAKKEYIKKCQELCSLLKLDYIIFDEFLDQTDIAKLRNRANIFINAQTTDAFSGSFCEYLYADTLVLNAKWLHYSEIDEYGISCVEFSSFEEISAIVEKYINNPYEYRIDTKKNREIIRCLRSVEICKEKWRKIFTS